MVTVREAPPGGYGGDLGWFHFWGHYDPTVKSGLSLLVLLTLLVTLFAIVDLIRRGRARKTAMALTHMVSVLCPFIGLYLAASWAFNWSLNDSQYPSDNPISFMRVTLAVTGLPVAVGMACGSIGVILTAILRMDAAWASTRRGEPVS